MTVDQEKKYLKSEFRVGAHGDVWGHAMHWFFTVADELYWRTNWTPAHWEFRASPLGPVNDPDDYATTACVDVGSDALTNFGNILFRYCRRLDSAGLSS